MMGKEEGKRVRPIERLPPFREHTIKEMLSKTALRPRTYFLKRQPTSLSESGGRMGFSLRATATSATTKESMDLKEYAEKMMREQKMSSQKLVQLVSLSSFPYPVGNVIAANDTYSTLLSSKPRKTTNPHKVVGDAQDGKLPSEGVGLLEVAASGANGLAA